LRFGDEEEEETICCTCKLIGHWCFFYAKKSSIEVWGRMGYKEILCLAKIKIVVMVITFF